MANDDIYSLSGFKIVSKVLLNFLTLFLSIAVLKQARVHVEVKSQTVVLYRLKDLSQVTF
jgi:hypothetical protein